VLAKIQRILLKDQVEEISEVSRVCRFCGSYLPVHDRGARRIDTLFGRVTVRADPRDVYIRFGRVHIPHDVGLLTARSVSWDWSCNAYTFE